MHEAKHNFLNLCVLCALCGEFFLVAGCNGGAAGPQASHTYPTGPAVCQDGPAAPKATVYPDIHTIGTAANVIAKGDGYLWVVESTSNTVSRFDPRTGEYDAAFVDVGDGHNPYDVAVDAAEHRLYITNWLTNTLSVASTKTGHVIAEVGEAGDFDSPQGVAFSDGRIYVANSAYHGPGDYGAASVTVLDRHTLDVLAKIDAAQPNAAFVRAVDTPDGPRVLVVDTGRLEVTNDGAFVRSDGAVELWNETDDPAAPERKSFPIHTTDDPRMGAPGKPVLTPDGSAVYLPSATASVVFKFGLAQRKWLRDTADPIVLYQTGGDAAHSAAIDSHGMLYVTALNEDAMYLVDTHCDEVLAGPLELGTTDAQLEEPQDVAVVEDGGHERAFFVMTLSNAMGKVSLEF